MPKVGSHFGHRPEFFNGDANFEGFHGQHVQFHQQGQSQGCDKRMVIPLHLQEEVKELEHLTHGWSGRPFQGKVSLRKLFSDSSQTGWGGLDSATGECIQEFWRGQDGLHINVKELQAAINTVRSLARPKEKVHLFVENAVAFAHLRKMGWRLPQFNFLMRPFLRWCMENQIQLQVTLVKSEDQLADSLSRLSIDQGYYTLNRQLFLWFETQFLPWVKPQVDMFASPGNSQLVHFVSRNPHWQAIGVDALQFPLEAVGDCYAYPLET